MLSHASAHHFFKKAIIQGKPASTMLSMPKTTYLFFPCSLPHIIACSHIDIRSDVRTIRQLVPVEAFATPGLALG
jgi:hypothetical protein